MHHTDERIDSASPSPLQLLVGGIEMASLSSPSFQADERIRRRMSVVCAGHSSSWMIPPSGGKAIDRGWNGWNLSLSVPTTTAAPMPPRLASLPLFVHARQ